MNSLNTTEYQVDIIFQGYPGKAVCHGNLGWSTVSLLRGHQRNILLDTGPMGIRKDLVNRLAQHGISPSDITDLLLTHSHHDHCINWTLFSQARIFIGEIELNWALKQKWGETSVAELYIKELRNWPTLRILADGDTALPGITAHLAPGHTPGSLVYRLQGKEHDVIFTGDAAKNRAELQSCSSDMTYDPKVSAATISHIRKLWCGRDRTVLVPGHDLPMMIEDGVPRYIATREAAVRTWFGDDMATTKTFELI